MNPGPKVQAGGTQLPGIGSSRHESPPPVRACRSVVDNSKLHPNYACSKPDGSVFHRTSMGPVTGDIRHLERSGIVQRGDRQMPANLMSGNTHIDGDHYRTRTRAGTHNPVGWAIRPHRGANHSNSPRRHQYTCNRLIVRPVKRHRSLLGCPRGDADFPVQHAGPGRAPPSPCGAAAFCGSCTAPNTRIARHDQ